MIHVSFITRISTALISLFRQQPSTSVSLTQTLPRQPDSTPFSQHTFKRYRDERGAITSFEYDLQGILVSRHTSWLNPHTESIEISNLAMLV